MRVRSIAIALTLTFCAPPVVADDFSWPTGMQGTSFSGGTVGQDEYHTETDGTYPEQTINLAAETRGRLVVEWGRASMAAERLVALPQTKRLYDHGAPTEDFKGLLYQQAWNVIEDADRDVPKPKPVPTSNIFQEHDWDARMKAALKLNIRWSEAANKYIVN